jgi:hypothetical protein
MSTFNFNIDLYNEGAKTLQDAILEKTFGYPNITDIHSIDEGIVHNKQIPFLGKLKGFMGRKVDLTSQTCKMPLNECEIPVTQKLWTPINWGSRKEECWKDLEVEFFKYMLNKGVKKQDITDTDIGLFLIDRYGTAINESIWKTLWFSDVDAAAYNASPAGNFFNGGLSCVTVDDFNAIDGAWKQIFQMVAANSNLLVTDLSAKNNQATFALQKFNATDTANRVVTNALFNVTAEADSRLKSAGDKVLLTTDSVAIQFMRELRADSVNFTHSTIMDGFSVLKSDGIVLLVVEFWDRIIEDYSRQAGNVDAAFRPHRILYTTKDNLRLGVEDLGAFSQIDAFYDKYNAVNVFEFMMKFDVKVLEDYMIKVAY